MREMNVSHEYIQHTLLAWENNGYVKKIADIKIKTIIELEALENEDDYQNFIHCVWDEFKSLSNTQRGRKIKVSMTPELITATLYHQPIKLATSDETLTVHGNEVHELDEIGLKAIIEIA